MIYFVLDNRYFPAAITPLWQLRKSGRNVIVYDCDSGGLNEELKQFVIETMPYVSFKKIQDRWFDQMNGGGHYVSKVCLARLEAMRDAQCELALYLDADIFFVGDVNRIFDYGLAPDEIIGGCVDTNWIVRDLKWKAWYDYIDDFSYHNVNAGILLFNPLLFRQNDIFEKCKQAAIKDNPPLIDQDVLNKVVEKKRILPWYFNGNVFYRDKLGIEQLYQKDIVIWHYVADYSRPFRHLDETSKKHCPFYSEYTEIHQFIFGEFFKWKTLRRQEISKQKGIFESTATICHKHWKEDNGRRHIDIFDGHCTRYCQGHIEDYGTILHVNEHELHIQWNGWMHSVDCFKLLPEDKSTYHWEKSIPYEQYPQHL